MFVYIYICKYIFVCIADFLRYIQISSIHTFLSLCAFTSMYTCIYI